jgi:hypothetical protein
MTITFRKLSADDGEDVFGMLQELPSDENGFLNPMIGKSFDDYKQWLSHCVADAQQVGIVDGWKVPQSTY